MNECEGGGLMHHLCVSSKVPSSTFFPGLFDVCTEWGEKNDSKSQRGNGEKVPFFLPLSAAMFYVCRGSKVWHCIASHRIALLDTVWNGIKYSVGAESGQNVYTEYAGFTDAIPNKKL